MHSAFLRLNVVFFFAVSTLFVLALGCAAQYFAQDPPVRCELRMPEVTRFRQFHRPAPQWEHAQASFFVDTDLRPVFNWNTQQLFVYVSVEWESDASPVNRAVIWDAIVRSPEEALIQQEFSNEYTINDQFSRLRGRNIKASVHYDVMPIVGLLHTRNDVCTTAFTMPDRYV